MEEKEKTTHFRTNFSKKGRTKKIFIPHQLLLTIYNNMFDTKIALDDIFDIYYILIKNNYIYKGD